MKVSIDSSLLTTDGEAIGRLHGSIELSAVPPVGSSISFVCPKKPVSHPMISGFNGLVRVSELQFDASNEDDGVLVLLEDVVVPHREDGAKLASYLEAGFGLFLEKYE